MAGKARWRVSVESMFVCKWSLSLPAVSAADDYDSFGFARGGVEIFLDLAILTLPLPMLAKLNMSPKKKLQIMSMFCVGFIITIVSCLRLWSFVQFGNTTNPTCK
jgi:putative effector of murein hydrolase